MRRSLIYGEIPPWVRSSSSGDGYGDGYGSGYGSGDGSGHGYGSGCGYGSGYGYGSSSGGGYGSGDGCGYGYGGGYGSGDGCGYGYGDGGGYGSGDGCGYGYGDGSGYGYLEDLEPLGETQIAGGRFAAIVYGPSLPVVVGCTRKYIEEWRESGGELAQYYGVDVSEFRQTLSWAEKLLAENSLK